MALSGLQVKKLLYRKNDIRRVDKWLKMISRWEEVDSLWHRMYRNGRASEKKMLQQALSSSGSLNQIDLDVNRTFRNTVYFRDRYGPRQCALFRVLAAYSVYNSEVGYCQGMSELAGLFLIYIEDEEDAFWALNQLMTSYRYNMHSVYVADFPGLKRLFTHHERIVRKLLPILDKHFTKHDMLTSTYALKWYMQCFLDRLPVTLVLRLWDIYLLEGEKLLLAMAYNILKMHSKRLLRMDQMQMTSFFQDELVKDFLFDDDDVIDSLKDCLELLHKNKLDTPPPLAASDMLPKRLGQFNSDPVWRNRNGTLVPKTKIGTLKSPTESPPHIKPQLTDNSSSNGKLRARFSPTYLPKTLSVTPITLGSVSVSSIASKSPGYSPGLATSASILTAAAMKNSGRLYVPAVRSSQTYGNGPNYTFMSNQKIKLDHTSSSKSEAPYSPSFSVDESISSSVLTNNLTTSSSSLINSPDESYATTGGRHYRILTRLSSSSNRSKVLHRYELDYDKNDDSLSVGSNPTLQKSSQLRLSRFTQNKEIIINRPNVGYSSGIKQKPDIPFILTTSSMTPSSRINRWTSEQILSVNVNRRSSTTSSEISLEQPWQKREKSPSKIEQETVKKGDYSGTGINSSIDGLITRLDETLVPPPLSTTANVWNIPNYSNYPTVVNSNFPINSSIYSPTSSNMSTESQDTKCSQTVFTSSSASLSPATKPIQIIRSQCDKNDKSGVDGYYYLNVSMKKPYLESVQPINDYVRRIPSVPRSKIIMKPTEIIMPDPKPVSKAVNKKLITIQSTN
ncbi:USP6 N-terminal-like protein [Schistosoma mansoni]|uniref:USP6 N-terminal-like protein n=1 Tax=Schistosoma mansoni TaxID=6183 RepID=UPI0001A61C9B|nr:USP6 N-terminal-like protein [Schistosoma mansoni]|eukprot:XP_018653102.1 USP6 N-terminal-like protein [Schistosoma mansoni]